MLNDNDGRPDPLRDALAKKGPIPAAAGAILSLLVGAGILSTTGVTVVGIALAGLSALVTLGTSAATAWKVIAAARAGVTPSGDPRTDAGDELVPRTGQLLAEVLEQILDAGVLLAGAPAPAPPARDAMTGPLPVTSRASPRADPAAVGRVRRDEQPGGSNSTDLRPTPAQDPASTRLPLPQPAAGRHAFRTGR